MSGSPLAIDDDPLAWAAAQSADPVRRRMLQALALRAQAQPPGALRDKLIAALRRRAASRELPVPPRLGAPSVRARPLAELLRLLQPDTGHELRQLRLHHGSWRQLRIAGSLVRLDAPVAEHLGPLNGQALATRTLQQIQQLAPDYLHRLLTQIDAIAALEQVQAQLPVKPQPGADAADKPPRGTKAKASGRRR